MATLSLATTAVKEEVLKLQDALKLVPSLEDVFARFQIWVGNNGADRTDRLSLEWRVRKVQILQDMLAGRLSDLLEDLQLLGDTVGGVDKLDEEATSDCTQLIEAIHEDISGLFKLSAVAKKSTLRDIFTTALARVGKDEVKSLDDEAEDICDRYPRLRQPHLKWLLDRLAQANQQRRRFLLHRERHQVRVAAPPEEVAPEEYRDDNNDDTATEYSRDLSTATSVDLVNFSNAVSQADEDDTESQASALSYATTADDHIFCVKPLSDFSHGRAVFVCPYCREEQQIKTQYVWERHVHADLRTYVCSAPACGAVLFTTSRAWLEHQIEEHFTMCSQCGEGPLSKPEQAGHQCHGQQPAIWGPCDTMSVQECRFCDWSAKVTSIGARVSLQRYRRHMASHLEQVAMLTIEHDQIEKDEDSAQSEGQEEPLGMLTDQQQGLKDWLAAPDATPPRLSPKHEPIHGPILEIHALQAWYSGTQRTICVFGEPGSGKSMLLREIVDQLSTSRTVLSYSFDHRNSNRAYTAPCLRSLLLQICQQSNNWTVLADLYATCMNGSSSPNPQQVYDAFVTACSSISELTIAMDAIDECMDISWLVTCLETFVRLFDGVQLFLTSRPSDNNIKAELVTLIAPSAMLNIGDFQKYALRTEPSRLRTARTRILYEERQVEPNWFVDFHIDTHQLDTAIETATEATYPHKWPVITPFDRLCRLSLLLEIRWLHATEGTTDIDEAIILMKQAIGTARTAFPTKLTEGSIQLGSLLRMRSRNGGGLKDMNEAIAVLREAIPFTSDPSHRHRHAQNNLATCLGQRYELSEELQDINEAIGIQKSLVGPVGETDSTMARRLNNLAVLLGSRAIKNNSISDLNEAVITAKRALNLARLSGVLKKRCADGLYTALIDRYNVTHDPADFEEADTVLKWNTLDI